MTDSEKPDEGEQEAKAPDTRIAKPPAPPPQEKHAAIDAGGIGGNPSPPQPILVRLVAGDNLELKPFEEQTLAISRGTLDVSEKTYWIAKFAFLAALAAAVFVGVQVYEMTKQTQILASQSEGANAGALMDEMNTRRQMDIVQKQVEAAQQQAQAAQEGVKAIQRQMRIDQRPWLEFEIEGERPSGIDPNNNKTHIIPVVAGQPIKIKTKVINVGKTTAENLLGTLLIQIVPKNQAPVFPNKGKIIFNEGTHCIPKGPNNLPGTAWREGTLYRNEVSENEFSRMRCGRDGSIEDDPITQAEKAALDNGQSYIVGFGEVWYSDVFGVRHWTKFCQMANPQINIKIAEKCTRFDAVDNN